MRTAAPVRRRAAVMAAGLGTAALAVAPPVERLAAERFAAHMIQHLVLMLVAAPLLASARPLIVRQARRLLAVWLLGAAVLWAWHSPGLYQLALRSDAVHAAEHVTLLGSAALFWSVVLGTSRSGGADGPSGRPAAVALVFATALASGALGAVLAFAGAPLYPEQAAVVAAAGVDPLADQQLAGALMWVPPGLVYLAVMVGLVVSWFVELDRRTAARPAGPSGGPIALRGPGR